jgi:LacI family transcriptional regulator
MGRGISTIRDVARAANVSTATVSRVLNGHEVSPSRAARVRMAVRELSYQPHGPARALRRQVTQVWAAIVADVGNPFFTSVVRSLEDAARPLGHRVILCNTDEDLARERDYFEMAMAERMAGVIVSVASTRHSELALLVDAGIPVVAIDRRPGRVRVDCVVVDNRAGARAATAHLCEAGSERIACITGPTGLTTANHRVRGYTDAIKAAGGTESDVIVSRQDFRERGGFDAVMQLCSRKRRPDALFVANNLMTVGALQALRQLRLKVPQDVALVGFDDAPWTTLVQPQLTVVSQPTYQIGQVAAELLARSKTEMRPPKTVTLRPSLIVRESSLRS